MSARVALRVVVLRALGLGDLLTALPALRGLRTAWPTAHITLAAPHPLAPLALHSGAVDDVVDTLPLAPLAPELAGADLAVNLHGRGPQSHRLLLAAAPRRLVAFAHPGVPESRAGPAWRADEHEVRRWCRLLAASGVPADPTRLELAPPPGQSPVPGAVVVHPGAASPARRWPVERWAAVAAALDRRGEQVVITGSAAEAPLADAVVRGAGLSAAASLAGRTSVLQLAAVVAGARCLLSGDTGVAHLATALGTPSVLLFGPTPPALWGPPPARAIHRVLWSGTTGDPQAAEPDPGLLRIQPADVLAAVPG